MPLGFLQEGETTYFPPPLKRLEHSLTPFCDLWRYDWSKLNSPDDLVEKLDDYDTLRSSFRSKQPRKEWHYDKQNSFKDDPTITTNEKKKLYGITHNERGHKAINCVAKGSKYSSDESLSVRRVGEKSEESNSYLKKAKLNNCDNVQVLIDTGILCCLFKISVAQKFKPAVNKIYGLGNQKMPALTSIGRIKANIEVDNVKAESMSVYVVPDNAQSVDLIIRRTWLHLPHIAYTRIGKRVHIGYREYEPFRNFQIDEKVNLVCLETARLECESLQIKDSSQQKIMGIW
ncbi:hypothetical protein AVEN_40275-1 [Araneus ventricosus]|uniref:Uncharacterized protein n=1 Tax=Araneus ventricosus TaxID=182803 RepID=A0A4Y2W7X8_ARAVE|nr:hypothetical protein AVEN_40275-1 [Araneus ventricosus]